MPLTVTGDKGSELGLLISLITTMRWVYHSFTGTKAFLNTSKF